MRSATTRHHPSSTRCCQGNYAATVKEMMPVIRVPVYPCRPDTCTFSPRPCYRSPLRRLVLSARHNCSDAPSGLEFGRGFAAPHPGQARIPARVGCPQPSSRSRYRQDLRRLGLLRPPGSGPGQVRDGAARPDGGRECDPSRNGLRLFTRDVLSGSGKPGSGWIAGAGAQAAGTPRATQAAAGGARLPTGDKETGAFVAISGVGRAGAGEARHLPPSSDHRASPWAAEKRGASNHKMMDLPIGAPFGFVESYEALRAQALGAEMTTQPLGLALFLRRGLAAWLRSAAHAAHPAPSSPPSRSPQSSPVPMELRAEMALILTNMALSNRKETSS